MKKLKFILTGVFLFFLCLFFLGSLSNEALAYPDCRDLNAPCIIRVQPDNDTNPNNDTIDISVEPGTTVDFSITATDKQYNMTNIRWFLDGREKQKTPVPEEVYTFDDDWQYKFEQPGQYEVQVIAYDSTRNKDNAKWKISVDYGVQVPAGRSVYVWGLTYKLLENTNQIRKKFFQDLKKNYFEVVYLHTDNEIYTNSTYRNRLATLVKNIKRYGKAEVHVMQTSIDPSRTLVKHVLQFNKDYPDSLIAGVHFDAEPENHILVGGFLSDYISFLEGMRSQQFRMADGSYSSLQAQQLPVSIDVAAHWALSPLKLKQLLNLEDLTFFTTMGYSNKLWKIKALNKTILAFNTANKPFATIIETQEIPYKDDPDCDGDDCPAIPSVSGDPSIYEGYQNRYGQAAFRKLSQQMKDYFSAEYPNEFLNTGAHYYENSVSLWNTVNKNKGIDWDTVAGDYREFETVDVPITLRTSDGHAQRDYVVVLDIQHRQTGQIYNGKNLEGSMMQKVKLSGTESGKPINLQWAVPFDAFLGDYNVRVRVFDPDYNIDKVCNGDDSECTRVYYQDRDKWVLITNTGWVKRAFNVVR